MCVGHPKRHPCQHTSVNYNHCVAANFDPHTRVTTPCHNTTYAATIDSDSKCTNQLCYFEELGGSWICCQCNNGPNMAGWCTFHRPRMETNVYGQQVQVTTCDHCCCWNCTSYPGGNSKGGSGHGGGKHRKHHSSSKGKGGSSSHGGSSSQGGSSNYQWIEMDYGSGSGGGSSSHKKRKDKGK